MNKLDTTIAQRRRRQTISVKMDRFFVWGDTQVISNIEWDKPKNRKEIDEWHDKYLKEHIKELHEKSKPL